MLSPMTRRNAMQCIGASATCLTLPLPELCGSSRHSSQPVQLAVIADLHGGLAVDALQRLDTILEATAKQRLGRSRPVGRLCLSQCQAQRVCRKTE